MSASPAVRSLRAAVFAVLCVLLAAGGHALAMGAGPPVWAGAAGVVFVFASGCLLGGRERSGAQIGGAMLVAQAGLHVLFDAGRAGSAVERHAIRMVRPSLMTSSAVPAAVTHHATAVHIAAALLATWWLRRGEAAVWSLLRRAVAFVPGLAAWWRVRRGPWSTPVELGFVGRTVDEPRLPRQVLLRHTVSRRGPPIGVLSVF